MKELFKIEVMTEATPENDSQWVYYGQASGIVEAAVLFNAATDTGAFEHVRLLRTSMLREWHKERNR